MADSPFNRSKSFGAKTEYHQMTPPTIPLRFALTCKSTEQVSDNHVDDIHQKTDIVDSTREEGSDCPSPKLDALLTSSNSFNGSAVVSPRQALCTGKSMESSALYPSEIPPQRQLQQSSRRLEIVHRFSEAMSRGMLITINLSQVGLTAIHALVLKDAIMRNQHLSTLKLAYNNLGDDGTKTVASAIINSNISNPNSTLTETPGSVGERSLHQDNEKEHKIQRHHPSLSTIDLGFNQIGDTGCIALATSAISGNKTLQTLCLSGNVIGEKGAIILATALLNGCGISCLHLTANRIGTTGAEAITKAIAQVDAKKQSSIERRNGSALKSEIPFVRAVQELYLGGTDMGPAGLLSVFNMTLNNHVLKVISLCSANISDQDVQLFSQSISRNKNIPLEVIQLSFNRITCCGVESLMNAVWGSKTLQEITLDNNRIRDRGAQLIAVMLTSVKLIALNLGFNRITVAGIQPIMKMLTIENTTLESLTLSGNVIDTTAAKVISCALAYNTSLQAFCLDHCHLEHEAKRHITAGIISNERLSLKVITGFRLGVIIVTLGLPKILEAWSNEKVLKFIHFLWHRKQLVKKDGEFDKSLTTMATVQKLGKPMVNRICPADPAYVISAAKVAIEDINTEAAKSFMATICSSKIVGSVSYQGSQQTAQLSEASPTGNTRVILLDDIVNEERHYKPFEGDVISSPHSNTIENVSYNLEKKKRNIRLVHKYMTSLNELKHLPFKESSLWEIHQYFFSPIQQNFSTESDQNDNGKKLFSQKDSLLLPHALSEYVKIMSTNNGESKENSDNSTQLKKHNGTALLRKISFRSLSDAMVISNSMPIFSVKSTDRARSPTISSFALRRTQKSSESCTKKRTSLSASTVSTDESSNQLTSKRARISKARIDYYPRIRERIEILLSASSQDEILTLMRQAVFMEKIMLQDRKDSYLQDHDRKNPCYLTTSDIETILLDLI